MDEENKIECTSVVENYEIYQRIRSKGLLYDFLAVNQLNQETLICKILHKSEFKEKNIKNKDIQNSILIHSQIKHEQMFKIIKFIEDIDYYYIFYEYIEGKVLSRILSNNKNITFEEFEIFNIISQIINILIDLYNNNIILKDLSVRNIFIKEKKEPNDTIQVLLCNLENKLLLSKSKNKTHLELNYNNIVFKLGIIICQLLDYDFYLLLKKVYVNEEEDENMNIINEHIENKILKKLGITEDIKSLIINMILLGKDSRTHINKIKNNKWYNLFQKKSKNKINKKENNRYNTKEQNNESIINSSFSTCQSTTRDNRDNSKNIIKNNNVIEEIIFTDEG